MFNVELCALLSYKSFDTVLFLICVNTHRKEVSFSVVLRVIVDDWHQPRSIPHSLCGIKSQWSLAS